jgi:hypothetical protein
MDSLEQIRIVYRTMALRTKYRPAAPSDGFGNITVPKEELSPDREAHKYADNWWKSEDDRTFRIGCCDFRTRPATIFAVEAARLMCGGRGGNSYALKLLKMAVTELKTAIEQIEAAQ